LRILLQAISFPVRLAGGRASAAQDVPGSFGWSVVIEAAESADLARLREELSLLLPQTGSTTLFATAGEDGFVARLELANFRMRAEAYAAREAEIMKSQCPGVFTI